MGHARLHVSASFLAGASPLRGAELSCAASSPVAALRVSTLTGSIPRASSPQLRGATNGPTAPAG